MYHLSGTVGLYIAVDMRMSVYQLIAQCIDHIAYIETPLFRPHARIEDDVEQQVAQLLADAVHVAVRYRIGQFERLLYGVVAQRLESLLPVPRTLYPEPVHHPEQALHGLKLFLVHAVSLFV